MITPEVATAIEDIRQAFPGHPVTADEDGQGGAFVTVSDLGIGDKYTPATASFSFHVGFQYPRSDVYPHYIDAQIKRVDNLGFGQGVSNASWREKPHLQLSRRRSTALASGETPKAPRQAWH